MTGWSAPDRFLSTDARDVECAQGLLAAVADGRH